MACRFHRARPAPSSIMTTADGNTASGSSLTLLRREYAILIGRAKIDIDATHPVAGEDEELGIAETLSVFRAALIGHESLIAIDQNPLELLARDPVGALPAL